MNYDLFNQQKPDLILGQKAILLGGWAKAHSQLLVSEIENVQKQARFRFLKTPGGYKMTVAMTCCGQFGWHSDQNGYRYTRVDPISSKPWPPMPESLKQLAHEAATQSGFPNFKPDACLINVYKRDAKLSLHQDKDEKDLRAPIVSFSLGVSAQFLFGGPQRKDPKRRVLLEHGDVVVWGGPSRLNYHGIERLVGPPHPGIGDKRVNITFRQTGLS